MRHNMGNRWKKATYKLSNELSTDHTSELIHGMGDFKGHVERNIDGLDVVHELR